jgi:P-type conjugative transfer protein TrbJ
MTHPRIRRLLLAVALTVASGPAAGQMVVYDPSNYAQNVLRAARALQQINNQVTSLQNQTQMLRFSRNVASPSIS